jgi:DNA-binding LacI/PurR family transcriptional regulator
VRSEGGAGLGSQERSSGRQGSVTLRDVALDSGVSITTVSRILNGRESGIPIRDETRQRVLRIASQLGYTPNLLARGLRGSKSQLLGAIARDISDPFHIQVLRGINEAARDTDYRLFLGHIDYRPEAAIAYGSMFERSHADGIIVIGDIEGGDEAVDVLAQQHRHVLGVTDRTGRRQVPGVYGDSVAGSLLALEHLWGLGHRDIACVSDHLTYDGRRRIEVYEGFMREHGAADRIRVHVASSPGSPEPSFELGKAIFAEDRAESRSTAIFATSDTIAVGLIRAAYEAGLAIPNDLSIVGYDNIDVAEFTIPPLTTVSQSGLEMGRVAAELLFDMIANDRDRADVADVVIAPELVIRQSTAPPR